MEITCITFRYLLVAVVAGPYCACVIWCISYEPEVIVCICSTCLTCNCHIIKLAGCTGTILNYILKGACKKISSCFLNDGASYRVVLNQYVSVVIKNLGVVNRFDIITAVRNGCVCGAKLYVLNTVGQTAKCCRQVGICVNIAIGIGIRFCTMRQCSKSKVVQVFQTKLRGYILKTLNCNGIDRITDRCTDRSGTIKAAACIIDRCAVVVGDWLVFVSGSQRHSLLIKGCSIGGYDLKCRTWLTGTVCSTVQGKAGSLGSTSANDRLHISGMLVNDRHC